MKKSNLTLDQFKMVAIAEEQLIRTKGGHTKIRRPGNTTVVAIWDDTEIRDTNSPIIVRDMTLRIFRP